MQFSRYVRGFASLNESVKRLEGLRKRNYLNESFEREALKTKLERICREELLPSDGEIEARRSLDRLFGMAYSALKQIRDPSVDEFFAVRTLAYLRQIFNQLRYSLFGAMACGLPVIGAVATYAFAPKHFQYDVLWAMVALISLAIVVVFVQMNRDATLSAIGGTVAGKITFDRPFLANILVYALIPILSLAATHFPPLARLLSTLELPLSHILGGP